MKIKIIKILAVAMFGVSFITSCKKSTEEKTTEKPGVINEMTQKAPEKTGSGKEWSQAHRTEFLNGCVESASASYKSRGEEPNIELVTNICTCTGQDLEAKYSYEEANKISKEEIKDFITAAATRCGPGVE